MIAVGLVRKDVPKYLRVLIGNYFSERSILYPACDGRTHEGSVRAGVPPGSVLSRLLWNVVFDHVLEVTLPPNCVVTYHADDTLFIHGTSVNEVMSTRLRRPR